MRWTTGGSSIVAMKRSIVRVDSPEGKLEAIQYALRVAIYLAYQSDRRPCSVAEIAAREAIPKKFLEKIIYSRT